MLDQIVTMLVFITVHSHVHVEDKAASVPANNIVLEITVGCMDVFDRPDTHWSFNGPIFQAKIFFQKNLKE